MRMNRKAALYAGAGIVVGLVAAACSDSATEPTSQASFVPKPSFVVGDAFGFRPPVATELIVCKAGDVGGNFTIADVGNGTGGSGNPTIIAPQPVTINPGAGGVAACRHAVTDNGNATLEIGDFFTVTETVGAGVTSSRLCYLNNGDNIPDGCPATFFINTAHGWTVVVTNTAPPPPEICTYTKGWYQNKNGEPTIIAGIDGRSKDAQTQIFNASPGQPGNVVWGVGSATDNKPNNLLNLYQQLLAALNNLGGNATAGPPAVDAAIASALAITSGTGTQIFVTAGGVSQISGLINTLSSFNEGELAGFPHCSDEVVDQ